MARSVQDKLFRYLNGERNYDDKVDRRLDFMTDEEMRMVDEFITKIEVNRGYLGEYYDRWERELEAYTGDQELKENRPNTRVNMVNSNIEGQVSALVDQNLDVSCVGEGPGDQPFARRGEVSLDFILRKNHIKRLIKTHETRRGLFGVAWLKVHYDPDYLNGFGLAKIETPQMNSMYVDLKINDPYYLQDAEYICETMERSKQWAIDKYGDMAHHIMPGYADRNQAFVKEKTEDDEDAYWHYQLWTKTDGKLRLIEFSDDGVLLADSFKEWTGKKFKDIEDPDPYYRYNMYPYFLTNMYYEEGKLLGFGDGKLLRPIQDMINDLYDQIRRAARPNRVFFDEDSMVELEDLDTDDGPVPCKNPNQNIRVVEMGRVNDNLWNLLSSMHEEAQKVTRFSDLLLGQPQKAGTATEAAIQQQQGAAGIDHKKLMLQETLIEVCQYALDLQIEHANAGRWFKTEEEKDEYEFIDFREFENAPVLVPPTAEFKRGFQERNPHLEMPKWMQLQDEKGEPLTKKVELDIKISIGAGLPKNKAFLYQMLEKFSTMVVEGKNVVMWQEMRDFIEQFLGIPLEDEEEIRERQMKEAQEQASMQGIPGGMGQPGAPQQAPGAGQQALPNAAVGGLTAGGQPQLSALPGGGAVGPVG